MNYRTHVPANTQIAASGMIPWLPEPAPEVVADAPLNENVGAEGAMEPIRLGLVKAIVPGLVTDSEFLNAGARSFVILKQHAAERFPEAMEPDWVASINASIGSLKDSMQDSIANLKAFTQASIEKQQASIAELQTSVADLRVSISDLQASSHTSASVVQEHLNSLASVQARILNSELRKWNSDSTRTNLRPLHKVKPGRGPGLPGNVQRRRSNRHQIQEQVPSIGALPDGQIFPGSRDDLLLLSNEDLSHLSAWYNEDFDIVPTDDLSARRMKFLTWASCYALETM